MSGGEITPHKSQLRGYFDGIGFERWSKIYGTGDVSFIRRTVREGHETMLTTARSWLHNCCAGGSVLDAGCGTGLFSVSMAQQGFDVTALDIAPRMIEATRQAAQSENVADKMQFITGDAEAVSGEFDAVVCLDVLVHYPRESFETLLGHLVARSKKSLIITYAPYSRLMAGLHWVGGHFPKGQRRTEIQMIPDAVVLGALQRAGMGIDRTVHVSKGFYHVKLLQASR